MDEKSFVDKKRESWQSLSDTVELVRRHGVHRLSGPQLKALGAQYRALVSDLSFARSQKASDGLVTYLNELAARAHGVIFASRPTRTRRFAAFFYKDFPALFRSTAVYTLAAAIIFFVALAIPVANPLIADVVFPRHLASRDVDEDMSTILEYVDPAFLSTAIMTNNIYVGIRAFAGGVTAGAYTVYELGKNGLYIGAIALKASQALGPRTFYALVLPHGIIELAAIFICGGAGLMIGCSIIAPGNLRRRDAIRLAASKAVRLFAGAAAMFGAAGIIEGFVTPSALPSAFKLVFAGVSALALAYYFTFAGTRRFTP